MLLTLAFQSNLEKHIDKQKKKYCDTQTALRVAKKVLNSIIVFALSYW